MEEGHHKLSKQISLFGDYNTSIDSKDNSTLHTLIPKKSKKKRKKNDVKKVILAHSKAKLTLYENYLEKYLAILSVVPFIKKIHIFDIFCGTGIYNDGKFGSPILAFNNINKVNNFLKKSHKVNVCETILYINDLNKENVKNVQIYLSSQPKTSNLDIKYSTLDAQEMLEKVLMLVNDQSFDERNLIFLDPYGYRQIKKETIEKLIKTNKVEIILFLPTSQMYRFKDVVQVEDRKAYEALRNFIFDFFDPNHPIRLNENGENTINIFDFIEYLREAFSLNGTCYSSSFYLQRDASNYYALFFLTKNLLGLERIIDAKWLIDTTKGKGFLLDNRQHSLFREVLDKSDLESSLAILREIIIGELVYKKNIDNCDLYYIALMSNFRPTHARQVLERMQDEEMIVVCKIDGKKRKKGDFYIGNKQYSKKEIIITVSLTNNHGRIKH